MDAEKDPHLIEVWIADDVRALLRDDARRFEAPDHKHDEECAAAWAARDRAHYWAQRCDVGVLLHACGLAEAENLEVEQVETRLRRLAFYVQGGDKLRREAVYQALRAAGVAATMAKATFHPSVKPDIP